MTSAAGATPSARPGEGLVGSLKSLGCSSRIASWFCSTAASSSSCSWCARDSLTWSCLLSCIASLSSAALQRLMCSTRLAVSSSRLSSSSTLPLFGASLSSTATLDAISWTSVWLRQLALTVSCSSSFAACISCSRRLTLCSNFAISVDSLPSSELAWTTSAFRLLSSCHTSSSFCSRSIRHSKNSSSTSRLLLPVLHTL
mmetsp:Transcript_34708/g.108665  ORF Transcript_34708/g.108665 Transcript_34708/m.108665 type:complete len:200 (+) Transcript_34708:1554-2153(+)